MNPKIWGPYLWTSLIYIVLSYPDAPTIDEKNDYRSFFESLGKVLPCLECRKNYCNHLKIIELGDFLEGKPALLNWLWRVHNQINDFCGSTRLTMEQFLKKYMRKEDYGLVPGLSYGQTGESYSLKVNWIWLILLVLLVLYWNK